MHTVREDILVDWNGRLVNPMLAAQAASSESQASPRVGFRLEPDYTCRAVPRLRFGPKLNPRTIVPRRIFRCVRILR